MLYNNCTMLYLCVPLQVVLKIIKHSQEEGAGGTDLVQGVLLGLVVDNRLEITNCFPFPRHTEEDDFDEGQCSVGWTASFYFLVRTANWYFTLTVFTLKTKS